MASNTGEPDKTTGQFHSLKGTVVETIGDLTGAQTWTNSGKEEHAAGEAEYNAAQTKQFVDGAADRVGGYKDSVLGALAGDKTQQAAGNVRKEAGHAQQKANEPAV